MFCAVQNRCAVDLSSLQLPLSETEMLEQLHRLGFERISVDLVTLAQSCVGVSSYRRGAQLAEAPTVFDCSSFMKWLYAQRGIWLPRRTIQQLNEGASVALEDRRVGDLVYITGSINYYETDPTQGVGHVGMLMPNGRIIHAKNRKSGIVIEPFERFLEQETLRGIRRPIYNPASTYTFRTPPEREIETSDDIRWILIQQLPEN